MEKENVFFWIFVFLVFGTFLKNITDRLDVQSTSETLNKAQIDTTRKINVEPVKLPLIKLPLRSPDLILMDPLKELID